MPAAAAARPSTHESPTTMASRTPAKRAAMTRQPSAEGFISAMSSRVTTRSSASASAKRSSATCVTSRALLVQSTVLKPAARAPSSASRAPCVSAGFALVLLAVSLVSPAAAIEEADRLWLVGERAFADGLYPAARRALERFVAQYPKDARLPEAVLLLGKARLQTGDAAAALEAFKRAQMATPVPGRPQEARFWEAESLFRLKRFLDARDAYDAVVRADAAGPLAPEAFYGRAWSDLELKHTEAAVAGFRQLP